MQMHRPLLIATLALMAGCAENEQASKLADAQACMNDSSQTTVSRCMSKLDGVSGERADLMRCGIKFMEEGFDRSDRLVDVMEQLESETSANPTLSAMRFLAFRNAPTEAENFENAGEAQAFCNKTNAKGFIELAGYAYMATSLTYMASVAPGINLAAGETPTEQQLKDLIDLIQTPITPQEQEAANLAKGAIGQTVIQTHESACAGAESESDFCKDINEALSGLADPTNPEQVADTLLLHLG